MSDIEKEQNEAEEKQRIREQVVLLRPRAQLGSKLVFKIAERGADELLSNKRTAARVNNDSALIVWLELVAFALYLFDRAATTRLNDSHPIYMKLLKDFVISRFPSEVTKFGRENLSSEEGWADDISSSISTPSLQYFSLEQEITGAKGSLGRALPRALFSEFADILAQEIGLPGDKNVKELLGLCTRMAMTDILKEFGPAAEEPTM